MKIAAITDIHNNSSNLARAIRSINANSEIEVVINCGDIGSPKIIQRLNDLDKKQYIVLSTPDSRNIALIDACCRTGIDYFCDYGEVEIDGKKVGFSHEKMLAMKRKGCDVVFYGHSHNYKVEVVDGILFVCCGEIMGRRIPACYAVYDTQTGEVEKVDC
ncbi:MAG: YfcE family phosphodiesterase [Candidatus Thorarchaeota archaeon]|jgi:putative phosphoesterase